jgi:hypothetical protein
LKCGYMHFVWPVHKADVMGSYGAATRTAPPALGH